MVIPSRSRAEYMKQRRKATRVFYADIDVGIAEQFDKFLREQQKTKKQWLLEKINEELGLKK